MMRARSPPGVTTEAHVSARYYSKNLSAHRAPSTPRWVRRPRGPALSGRDERSPVRCRLVRGSHRRGESRARPVRLETVGLWIAIAGSIAVAAVGYQTTETLAFM